LAALSAKLEQQAERSRGLASVSERAIEQTSRLAHLTDSGARDAVHWYELSPHGFSFHATPLDLAPPLRELRAQSHAAWIFTSATLSVAGRFTHFSRQLGLDDPVELCLDSPFDFATQALAYLPRDLPDPSASDYVDRVVDAAIPVLQASRGRAFLLFTSHRALRRAAELLPSRVDFPLFVQGTAPRNRLLEAFRESGNGVLLGAASFWEGVDVAGEALSVVIIDKLPFAAPDDPVLVARLDALRDAGGNPFAEWQIPAAVIALKQGAGRLIRDVHDRGVLMLCDPRLTTRGYGKLFLASLPPLPRTRELADVQRFFGE
ncbi:MAG: ATP-dependent DNA helicase, partial [Dokdonella sp.]